MISITAMWVALIIFGALFGAGLILFALKMRDRALTDEELEAMTLFSRMAAEDTGGLMALPAPGVTVKIPPRDRRAATRTITHHEPPGREHAEVATAMVAPGTRPAGDPLPVPPGFPAWQVPIQASPAGRATPGTADPPTAPAEATTPAGDPPAIPDMSLDDYLGHISGIKWAHVTAEFPAIRDEVAP